MGKRKIIVLVFILLIITAGAAIFFSRLGKGEKLITVAQQTPPSTPVATQLSVIDQAPPFADWKIHRNDIFEFEFQYPQDWEVRDFTSSISDEYIGFYGVGPQSVREDTYWNIGITSISLAQEIERQKQLIANNTNRELVSVTDVQKFGVDGKKISQRNKTTKEVYSTYYVERNGRIYSIPADTTSTDALDQTSRRITDTFTFIK